MRASRPAAAALLRPCPPPILVEAAARAGTRRSTTSSTPPTATPICAMGRSEFPGGHEDATWYELTGAASASLTIHALLALAREPLDFDARRDTQRQQTPTSPGSRLRPRCSTATSIRPRTPSTATTATSPTIPTPSSRAQRIGAARTSAACGRHERLPDGERHALIVGLHGRDVPLQGQRPGTVAARDEREPRARRRFAVPSASPNLARLADRLLPTLCITTVHKYFTPPTKEQP